MSEDTERPVIEGRAISRPVRDPYGTSFTLKLGSRIVLIEFSIETSSVTPGTIKVEWFVDDELRATSVGPEGQAARVTLAIPIPDEATPTHGVRARMTNDWNTLSEEYEWSIRYRDPGTDAQTNARKVLSDDPAKDGRVSMAYALSPQYDTLQFEESGGSLNLIYPFSVYVDRLAGSFPRVERTCNWQEPKSIMPTSERCTIEESIALATVPGRYNWLYATWDSGSEGQKSEYWSFYCVNG